MGYQLASSSTEEGEIVNSGFPFNKSHLQYYYYPHTSKFIGKNTIPLFVNYKSDLYCIKLKKDIKADYTNVLFNLLETKKMLFENKFVFCKSIDEPAEQENFTNPFVLTKVYSDYKELPLVVKRTNKENSYSKYIKEMFFIEKEKINFVTPKTQKLIVIEDRILEAFEKPNAFILCKSIVTASEKDPSKSFRKLIFEDVVYNKMYFYEYLQYYGSNIARNTNGYETRIYDNNDDTILIIRSNTVFKEKGLLRRMHSIFDEEKNTLVIFNKNEIKTLTIKGERNDNVKYLTNLELPEGDFVINNKNVYRISNDGETFTFSDIDFTDFFKNRWDEYLKLIL